jgi:hypothetical protein
VTDIRNVPRVVEVFNMPEVPQNESSFLEFRRKVREAEVLSAAMERLLNALRFTGRLSVVVQNGRVLKSGYEEGYFCHRDRAMEP